MERQREKARAAWSGSGDAATEAMWFPLREKAGATEFLGYETERAEGVVVALVRDGKEVGALKKGETGAVILNQTPFYGESGGQVGDSGWLSGEGARFRVADTQKKAGDLFVHFGMLEEGALKPGAALALEVDHARRGDIRRNHSATHLLHEALRQVLGDHVAQKGSLVAPDRLRFDFAHPKPIADGEIAKVEDIANAIVLQNAPVETRLMEVDDAIASGARALFGEKYGDEVRVVSMGKGRRQQPGRGRSNSAAARMCGARATSVSSPSFRKARSRRASAASRRSPATRRAIISRARREACAKRRHSSRLRSPKCRSRLDALLEERKRLERELADAKKKLAMGGGAKGSEDGVRTVGKVKYLARAVTGIEMKDLKSLADEGKRQIGSGIVAIVGVNDEGRAGLVVGVTDDLTTRFNAVELVRHGSEALGGKGGGGRPDMAQAGGPDGSKAEAALAAIEAALGNA